jgi:hypothetical protein
MILLTAAKSGSKGPNLSETATVIHVSPFAQGPDRARGELQYLNDRFLIWACLDLGEVSELIEVPFVTQSLLKLCISASRDKEFAGRPYEMRISVNLL